MMMVMDVANLEPWIICIRVSGEGPMMFTFNSG